jgi:hypothetical protein
MRLRTPCRALQQWRRYLELFLLLPHILILPVEWDLLLLLPLLFDWRTHLRPEQLQISHSLSYLFEP